MTIAELPALYAQRAQLGLALEQARRNGGHLAAAIQADYAAVCAAIADEERIYAEAWTWPGRGGED